MMRQQREPLNHTKRHEAEEFDSIFSCEFVDRFSVVSAEDRLNVVRQVCVSASYFRSSNGRARW